MPIEPVPDFEGAPSYSLTAYHQVGDGYPVFLNLNMTVEDFEAFPVEQADAAFQELVDLLAQSSYFVGPNGDPLRGSKSWNTGHSAQVTQTNDEDPSL